MTGAVQIRWVARVTLQFETPFLVGSGKTGELTDAVPVLDANGLPAIPGSSIAGVLRHGFTDAHGEERAAGIFGYAEGEDAHGSRLWFTWAHLHDQDDRPVDGRFSGDLDEILQSAASLSVRDHVRISHTGGAVRGGKFDQDIVPAGHRFTFEMTLEGSPDSPSDEDDFKWLLGHLASGKARIGGAGRRGFGAFRVVAGGCRIRRFDLEVEEDIRLFEAHPVRLDEEAPSLGSYEPVPPVDSAWRELVLELRPLDYWGFNGAEAWVLPGEDEGRVPDFNPVREERVVWEEGRGSVAPPRMYIPGSAIKGPLSHRVAFHENAASRRLADQAENSKEVEAWTGEGNPAVRELFGSMHRKGKDGADESAAGRVFIDDVWLPADAEDRLQRVMHNSSDRFTGGVRAGILFEERVLFRGPTVEIRIRVKDFDELLGSTKASFREALRDLAEGRLQLGAGAGRGHGAFTAVQAFDDIWAEFTGGAE